MSRCIALAKNGLGTTYPNPLVGSVIVHEDKIIGEGWHRKAGTPHAEVHAIQSVKNTYGNLASEILSNATIYVCLEPCSHYGKTPPCADLIISEGIKNVVIGCTDPNPQVAGRGIKKLFEAGHTVTIGILEQECEALNKRFFTFQNKKRPYIFLKWAETTNGFIAPLERNNKKPVWITNEYSRQWVHKIRAQEQAILIGTNTAIEDNPTLTTRDWKGSNPIRFVLDKSLRIPSDAHVFNNQATTIVFTEKEANSTNFIEYCTLVFSENLIPQILDEAYKKGIQSIIIEGGSQTLQSFIDLNLWDEAYVFKGTANFENGIKAPMIKMTEKINTKSQVIKNDTLFHIKNESL